MEDGFLNKKVAFIIQARMKSTRLPGKILLPLPLDEGKPLLSWIIDELKKTKFINYQIIVATSTNNENNILESFCASNNISCYRGDEDDVLSRFVKITNQDSFDCIVRLTADNPIIDIKILEKLIKHHFENNNDYTSTTGLPTGMNLEVIKSKALLDIENHVISNADKEHVTLFLRNSGKYSTELFTFNFKQDYKTLRLTIDYPSDFALLSSILSLSLNTGLSGFELIENTYAKYPWLFETNQNNFQKKQFTNLDEEISEAVVFLEQFDFKKASQILKEIK